MNNWLQRPLDESIVKTQVYRFLERINAVLEESNRGLEIDKIIKGLVNSTKKWVWVI